MTHSAEYIRALRRHLATLARKIKRCADMGLQSSYVHYTREYEYYNNELYRLTHPDDK